MHTYYPYFLVVESGDAVELTEQGIMIEKSTGSNYAVGDYTFVGTTVAISNTELYNPTTPCYILQSDQNWHKVPENQPKAYVGAFRCYFKGSNSSGARQLMTAIGGDDATDITPTVIRTVDHDGSQQYYDLSGRRLSDKPQRGLYICNGRVYTAKP